jgi:hypothetical protein
VWTGWVYNDKNGKNERLKKNRMNDKDAVNLQFQPTNPPTLLREIRIPPHHQKKKTLSKKFVGR